MNNYKKIAVIIPYFGRWPEWIDYFLHSCIHNPSVEWIFPTDCPQPGTRGDNLKFIPYSLQEFNKTAGSKLGLDLDLRYPYKLCDFKPAYGEIFSDLISGYDFWGYGDLDLVYGDIREFMTENVLDNFDIISNHPDFITGHLCLLRNTPEITGLYKTGGAYESAFTNNYYTGFDEMIKRRRINPDPLFLEGDQKKERKIHQARYRTFQQIKGLLPSGVHLKGSKDLPRRMNDFSSIVKYSEQTGRLRVMHDKTFESDLMLNKKGIKDWEIYWKNGSLNNKEGKQLLYFHFIVSKSRGSFRIMKYEAGLNEFIVSPGGISR